MPSNLPPFEEVDPDVEAPPPPPEEKPTTESFLANAATMATSQQTCQQIKGRVFRSLADELANKQVLLLTAAIKEYDRWTKDYTEQDQPDGGFYTLNDAGGFLHHATWSEPLVERLMVFKDNINALKSAIDGCLSPDATGTEYGLLATVMNRLGINIAPAADRKL